MRLPYYNRASLRQQQLLLYGLRGYRTLRDRSLPDKDRPAKLLREIAAVGGVVLSIVPEERPRSALRVSSPPLPPSRARTGEGIQGEGGYPRAGGGGEGLRVIECR